MTRNELNAKLAALLTTIDPTIGTPSGVLYAAFMAHGATLADYNMLVWVLEQGGLVDSTPSHWLTLTARGRTMAREIEQHAARLAVRTTGGQAVRA